MEIEIKTKSYSGDLVLHDHGVTIYVPFEHFHDGKVVLNCFPQFFHAYRTDLEKFFSDCEISIRKEVFNHGKKKR